MIELMDEYGGAIPFLKRNNLKLKIWDIVLLTVLVRVSLIVYVLQDNWIKHTNHVHT